ncbi:hypothetical protein ACGH7X_40730 [Streptomyces sp. BBFR51]|uniref:hypothetical protein n=1 Tax=Streptomyces sp. BBFR51 TaxID=3372856 RepID=UPI0037DC0A3D
MQEETSRMRAIKKAAIGCAAAAIPAVALLWTVAADHPEGDGHRDVPLVIGAGETCRSLQDPRYELSCGTTAFGDVRTHCTSGRPGSCPRTKAVTVRNVGRIEVDVTWVSGRREGDRRFSRAPGLDPGREVTMRPRPGDTYFFDIIVRSAVPGVGAIRVVDVS